MSSPILSVFLCNSWYYVQTPICPAVTHYFTKTFAKLGYNHHHHRSLISGKDWKQSVGVCWKRMQHTEKEVSIFMWYVCYLEWNSSAAFWVKRLRLTKNVAKTASQRKTCKIQPVRRSRTDGPGFCLFGEERQSPFIKEFNFNTSLRTLSGMLSAIHPPGYKYTMIYNAQYPNKLLQEWQDLWAVKLSHSFSTHSGVRHLFALCTPWHSQTELQGAEEHVYERKPQKKVLYSGTESRQIGGVIWTSQAFLINTSPFIPTFITCEARQIKNPLKVKYVI